MIASDGAVGRGQSRDPHQGGIQADLLVGFTQGGHHRGLSRLAAATGKSDLAGMPPQLVGSLGEQHGHSVWPFDQGNQHGRRLQTVDRQGDTRIEVAIGARRDLRAPAVRWSERGARQGLDRDRRKQGQGDAGAVALRSVRLFDSVRRGHGPE